jgi:hypothetical protein
MTLLLWRFVVVEGKTRNSADSLLATGVRLDASRARLTKRATSLQPHLKNNIQITTKNRERTTIKEGIKTLQPNPLSIADVEFIQRAYGEIHLQLWNKDIRGRPICAQKKSHIEETSDHCIVVLFESAFIRRPHTPSGTADASLPTPIG